MLSMLGNGFSVRRHRVKGLYICKWTRQWKPQGEEEPVSTPVKVLCTLLDGVEEEPTCTQMSEHIDDELRKPIVISYQGVKATLRPWDPSSCVLGAAISNDLIHFPIRPGFKVFAIDCSFVTLIHLADLVGSGGALTGVMSLDCAAPLGENQVRILRKRSNVTMVSMDLKEARLESYQLLLSLPESSKQAFQQGLDPSLGENSPVRKLAGDASKILPLIFSFLENPGVSGVNCLFAGNWARGTSTDRIHQVILSHIEILKGLTVKKCGETTSSKRRAQDAVPRWILMDVAASDLVNSKSQKTSAEVGAQSKSEGNPEAGREACPEESSEAGPAALPEASSEARPEACATTSHEANTEEARIPSATEEPNPEACLAEIFEALHRLPDGRRTGLTAREQLALYPHFSDHIFLVLKYSNYPGERDSSPRQKHAEEGATSPEEDAIVKDDGTDRKDFRVGQPTMSAVPIPKFISRAERLPRVDEDETTDATDVPTEVLVSADHSGSSVDHGGQWNNIRLRRRTAAGGEKIEADADCKEGDWVYTSRAGGDEEAPDGCEQPGWKGAPNTWWNGGWHSKGEGNAGGKYGAQSHSVRSPDYYDWHGLGDTSKRTSLRTTGQEFLPNVSSSPTAASFPPQWGVAQQGWSMGDWSSGEGINPAARNANYDYRQSNWSGWR